MALEPPPQCRMLRTCAPADRGVPSLQFEDFDASYLKRLQEGDPQTQEHFVAYFGELIQKKLRAKVSSPQAVADLCQETFVRVFKVVRTGGGIRHPERFGPFVIAVCNHVLMEHYRSSKREDPLEDEDSDMFPDHHSIDPLNSVIDKQNVQIVGRILETLTEKERRVLKEVFFDERDKDDVCRDFGVDRDYLRVLVHRAKQSFKSQYLKGKDKGNGAGAGGVR
jgi:RNA polymerase sigma-70 factor (ECF subfamily)